MKTLLANAEAWPGFQTTLAMPATMVDAAAILLQQIDSGLETGPGLSIGE